MQNSSKIDDKGLIRFLISKIPEFREQSLKLNSDSAYLNFGYFAVFLIDTIERGGDEDLVDRSFKLLNDLVSLEDTNINTMLRVEVIEMLADNKKSIPLCKEKLEGPALILFDKVSNFLETGMMPTSW